MKIAVASFDLCSLGNRAPHDCILRLDEIQTQRLGPGSHEVVSCDADVSNRPFPSKIVSTHSPKKSASEPCNSGPARKEKRYSREPVRRTSRLILMIGPIPPDYSRRSKGDLMPRYFFHTYHERAELDREGEELPDKYAAWREATVTAGQVLQGIDGMLTPDREWRMEVTDEFQNTLYVLHINAETPK